MTVLFCCDSHLIYLYVQCSCSILTLHHHNQFVYDDDDDDDHDVLVVLLLFNSLMDCTKFPANLALGLHTHKPFVKCQLPP